MYNYIYIYISLDAHVNPKLYMYKHTHITGSIKVVRFTAPSPPSRAHLLVHFWSAALCVNSSLLVSESRALSPPHPSRAHVFVHFWSAHALRVNNNTSGHNES